MAIGMHQETSRWDRVFNHIKESKIDICGYRLIEWQHSISHDDPFGYNMFVNMMQIDLAERFTSRSARNYPKSPCVVIQLSHRELERLLHQDRYPINTIIEIIHKHIQRYNESNEEKSNEPKLYILAPTMDIANKAIARMNFKSREPVVLTYETLKSVKPLDTTILIQGKGFEDLWKGLSHHHIINHYNLVLDMYDHKASRSKTSRREKYYKYKSDEYLALVDSLERKKSQKRNRLREMSDTLLSKWL